MKQVAQLLLMCDRQDLGLSIGAGEEGPVRASWPRAEDLDEPRIFLYDSYPGGIGFSEPLFGMHHALVTETAADLRVRVQPRLSDVRGPGGQQGRTPRKSRC